MHRYIAYLRTPRSQPLSIREFNARSGTLLDENRDFEHACMQAWQAGAAQRKRNVALTNAFPPSPPLKSVMPLDHGPRTVVVARWGTTPCTKQLNDQDVEAMRAFASNADAGVPPRLKHWIPACSARAVAAVLRQLDHTNHTDHMHPVLRLPCVS
jgi:hypothetical protein